MPEPDPSCIEICLEKHFLVFLSANPAKKEKNYGWLRMLNADENRV
jgi:hypothetical protein